jgi:hypothetical protein
VVPLLWWVERDFQMAYSSGDASSGVSKTVGVFSQSALKMKTNAIVSQNRNIVMFFDADDEKQRSILYIWEEGVGVSRALPGTFRGQWGTELSESFDKIVLHPLTPEAAYLYPDGELNCSTGESLHLSSEVQSSKRNMLEAQPRVFSARCEKKSGSEVSVNSLASILTFSVDSGRVYWRSYRLNGLEAANRSLAFGSGQRETWNVGHPGGVPVVGDYNGDGVLDLATFRPDFLPGESSDGSNWHLVYSGAENHRMERFSTKFRKGDESVYWGHSNAKAVPGDYDGDGATDMGVYFPKEGVWQVLLSSGGFNQVKAMLGAEEAIISVALGNAQSIPVPGDYDGDSCDDFATVQLKDKKYIWQVLYSSCHGKDARVAAEFDLGVSGDIPLVADFDGDGISQPAVYSAKNKRWFIRKAEKIEKVRWEIPAGFPFVLDIDGDGLKELGFYSSDSASTYSLYFLNRRFSEEVVNALDGRLPVVTKVRRSQVNHPPVQVLLYQHQRSSIDPRFLGELDDAR